MGARRGAVTETSLRGADLSGVLERLGTALDAYGRRFPGESGARQPVHTVYGGAHLFKADSARKLGELALRSLDEYAPDAATFADALGLEPPAFAATVYRRVRDKLQREPVEDFRIDFEDGYGNRPDDEEDATCRVAAREVARGMADATLPPFVGIRIKPFNRELHRRGTRTLDLFMTALVEETGGSLPDNFVIAFPKVVLTEQVAAFAAVLDRLEARLGLGAGTLKIELMVETPETVVGPDGVCPLPAMVAAAGGRCIGAHFGVYDYTASLNVTAAYQLMRHPVCDMARQVMQVALAGSGVMLSDGGTNILPVPVHRAPKGGSLSAEHRAENVKSVHRAWRLHFDDVRHSLENAFYQGWDLHPAQLPTRYAALFSFFLTGLDAAAERLRSFVGKAAQATLVGDVFDDAATGQGLLNYFLRGLNCGAITEQEAAATGLTLDELRSRSFLRILENRRG